MFASAWAAVSAVPARFSISPAAHNAMHPGKRPRMPFDLPSYACQNSMADTGIARSPHSCGSKAGMSTTRRSSACGAKKGCRSRDVTDPASGCITTSIPSFACVPCTRTTSGALTLSRTGGSGDAATRCSRSSMNTRASASQLMHSSG